MADAPPLFLMPASRRFRANSGNNPTFRYQASYWTTGWSSGQGLGQDANQAASYMWSWSEALFASYNNHPGGSVDGTVVNTSAHILLGFSSPQRSGTKIRLSMTISGSGTGSNVDVPISFSSLLSLFSQPPTVYSSRQTGLPAEWWANTACDGGSSVNNKVGYTVPLTLDPTVWRSAVPGGADTESFCNLQGVNIGKGWDGRCPSCRQITTRRSGSMLNPSTLGLITTGNYESYGVCCAGGSGCSTTLAGKHCSLLPTQRTP